jgi:hypothetical protein
MTRQSTVALLLAITFTGCANKPTREQVLMDKATVFLQQMARGEFANAAHAFGPPLSVSLTPDKLKAQWTMVTGQLGPFKSIRDSRTESQEGLTGVYLSSTFEKQNATVITWFDNDDRIVKLFYDPH